MLDVSVKYIFVINTSYINLYAIPALKKRGINIHKVVKKIKEVYGEYYNGHQFIEFGELYLDAYLIEKHNITWHDLLLESVQSIYHRFAHLKLDGDEFPKK